MRTKSLKMAIDYCARMGINMAMAIERNGWIYLPDKTDKFPSGMERRKSRSFEEISCNFRACSSGKAKNFPSDEYCGKTIKEKV